MGQAVLHLLQTLYITTARCIELKNLHLTGRRLKKPELEMSISLWRIRNHEHILRVNILWRRWWSLKNFLVRIGQI